MSGHPSTVSLDDSGVGTDLALDVDNFRRMKRKAVASFANPPFAIAAVPIPNNPTTQVAMSSASYYCSSNTSKPAWPKE